MTHKDAQIFVIPTGELQTNSVVVSDGKYCIVFDPSGATIDWVKWLSERDMHPVAIYLTHGHYDHIGAVAGLASGFSIPWHLHAADKKIITLNNSWGWTMRCPRVDVPRMASVPLTDGVVAPVPADSARPIRIGGSMEFIHTPGHTPGSGMFYLDDLNLLISGDTVFAHTIGRTDLPLASPIKMAESIAKIKALPLAPDTRVIPGHGPESTLGEILTCNPYFQWQKSNLAKVQK
jgi:glyoxylase-like metal-dependent hydrolase (beta-lactamase superfamily II)